MIPLRQRLVLYIERCAAMAHIPASVVMAVRDGDLTVVNSWLMNGQPGAFPARPGPLKPTAG